MNKNTLVAIMKLKDTSGAYLYKPFNEPASNGPIGSILSKNVVLSDLMPNVNDGGKPIALGDFKYYRILDREGFQIQRLNERYADFGMIGFRGYQRTDGKLLIPQAVKVLAF
jgi:HK97 family phage major capsid protein